MTKALVKRPPVKALKKVPKPPLKKTLVKPTKAEPKPTTAEQPVLPKGFKWHGKVDPMSRTQKSKQFYRIKPEDMPKTYPKLHRAVPPNTVWRMDVTTGVTNALVTVMPDGVNVAWAACGICLNHVDRCVCAAGIMHPKSIEHIYIMTRLHQASPGMLHIGNVDVTSPEYTHQALHWYKRGESGFVPEPGRHVVKPPAKQQTKTLVKTGKTLSKPAAAKKPLDITAMSKTAASKSKGVEAELTKALTKPKTLRKK